MSITQAEKQGLEFTGCYSFDKEKPKAEAKRIRGTGRRAVLVYEPGVRREGWSVYAAPEEAQP